MSGARWAGPRSAFAGVVAAVLLPGCFRCACPPPSEADCADGLDDDGDGLVDCADPDCAPLCADAAFSDAGPFCGDDRADPPEACDGIDVGGRTCLSLGFTAGALLCTPECALDLGACSGCGNGLVEPSEECDGADLAGAECPSLGFTGGALSCAPSCTFDVSACVECGNALLETGEECDDGNADDEDACTNACLIRCTPSAWSKWPGNPVMDTGPPAAWDGAGVQPGQVLQEGAVWRLWYSGFDGTTWRIGHASSPDGIAWTSDGLVLDVLPGGWDALAARDPHVLLDGSEYRMWYSGFDGEYWRVLDATSPDGLAWTRGGIVVEDLDDGVPCCEMLDALQPWAWWDGYEYAVVYVGREEYAPFPPSTLTEYYRLQSTTGGNLLDPINTDGLAGEIDFLHPYAALVGLAWRLFYASENGTNERVALAVGFPDGDFSEHGVILGLGSDGTWDDVHVSTPVVDLGPDEWRLWYGGFDGTAWRVGYATAACATP